MDKSLDRQNRKIVHPTPISVLLHVGRVGVFVGLVCLIRQQHVWFQAQQAGRDAAAVSLERIRRFYPDAAVLSAWEPTHGGRVVVDESGRPLGFFVQTSPLSDRVVGYSGPTNTLIAFDADGRVLGLDVLSSGDTREHVRDVVRDERFLKSLDGLTWDEAARAEHVDAVSGATLTSLAIREGLSLRLGGTRPSLRFPDELTLDELKQFFPTGAALRSRPDQPAIVDVIDSAGVRVGAALRTSPAGDAEMGFQGPTDTLIVLDADDRVEQIAIRRSYDNEPYVGYVRDEESFARLFRALSLQQLAESDSDTFGIEGVSGATMTSQSLVRALAEAARTAGVRQTPPRRAIVFAARDVGTVSMVLLGLAMSFTRLRRHRFSRVAFQIGLVVYLGFLNGDLISQALFVGWAQSGVPWRLAPGLTLMTAAALVVPVISKKQPYCHHVCPFGAAQQLVRNRLPWQVRLPGWCSKLLRAIPACLLLVVVATAMLHLPLNLAGLEPFDAFLFTIAGVSTLLIAGVGLIASAFVPMAYCRFGCPTGAMLNYLRFNAHSDRFTRRDAIAVGLLIVALSLGWL